MVVVPGRQRMLHREGSCCGVLAGGGIPAKPMPAPSPRTGRVLAAISTAAVQTVWVPAEE